MLRKIKRNKGNVGKAEVNRKETVNGRERKMKGRENDRK